MNCALGDHGQGGVICIDCALTIEARQTTVFDGAGYYDDMARSRVPAVVVRDATASDLDAMLSIARERLPISVSMLERAHDREPDEPSFVDLPGYSWLVACSGAAVVGFAVVLPFRIPSDPPGSNGVETAVGNLGYLAASAAASGIGVGDALLRECAARRRQMGGYLMVAHVPLAARALYTRAGWTVLSSDRGYAWQSPVSDLFLADWADDPEPFVYFAYKKLRPLAIEFTFEHIGAPPVGRASVAAMLGNYEGTFSREALSPAAVQIFAGTARLLRAQR